MVRALLTFENRYCVKFTISFHSLLLLLFCHLFISFFELVIYLVPYFLCGSILDVFENESMLVFTLLLLLCTLLHQNTYHKTTRIDFFLYILLSQSFLQPFCQKMSALSSQYLYQLQFLIMKMPFKINLYNIYQY